MFRSLIAISFCLTSIPSFAGDNPLSEKYQLAQQKSFWDGVKQFFGAGTQPSKWEDVQSWKAIGNRFASAYDAKGNLIAIYDLSYPDLKDSILLGTISHAPTDAQTMLSLFNSAQQDMSGLSGDVQKSIAALGSAPSDVANAAFLQADWWKNLPWNPNLAPQNEPEAFRLTDFDSTQLKLPQALVSGLRNLFQILLNDTGSLDQLADADILNAFQFVRAPDGSYELHWSDPRSLFSDARPRKLLDFVSQHSGLYDNIKMEAITEGLSEAVSLIPVPVVEALVATAISRVGRYYKMTQTSHLEMLREVVIETSEASIQDTVLAALSSDDLHSITDSFEWTTVTVMDIWKWIFANPDNAWSKDANAAITCANQSEQWLSAHGQTIIDLNARFATTVDAKSARALYLKANVCASGNKAPTLSINYADPTAIAADRLKKEWIGVSLEFGSHFVPLAGFLVNTAYGFLVQNAVDKAETWEARLTEHLERRTENWDSELSILETQRINPFEMTRAKMEQVIAERKQLLGL